MPLLADIRHERFAELVATGEMDVKDAYKQVFPNASDDSCNAAGSRLLRKVAGRVDELRELAATATTLTIQDSRETLAKIVRDPATTPRDKIAAILADAKLSGELTDRVEHSGQINSEVIMTEEYRAELMAKVKRARGILPALQIQPHQNGTVAAVKENSPPPTQAKPPQPMPQQVSPPQRTGNRATNFGWP